MPPELNPDTEPSTGAPADLGTAAPDTATPAEPAAPHAAEAFLDTLIEDPAKPTVADNGAPVSTADRIRDEHGRFAPKAAPTAAPAVAPAANPAAAPAVPAVPAAGQPPLDDKAKQAQEDAELLAGIKSERGRERVQKLISERNEAKELAGTSSQSLTEIQRVVQSAGMDAQQFAEQIEFARLYNSGDPQNLRVAAQMIEGIRADIYKKLGQDAPGVDVLSDFPDLAQKVNNFEMDRQSALEVARYRRQQQVDQARQQSTQTIQRQSQQNTEAFQSAMGQVQSYLTSKAQMIDHQPRMEVLGKYFKDPNNIQEFIKTYQPAQMAAAIKWMYDNIQVAPAAPSPSPLRARPSPLGAPAADPNARPIDRMASILDTMGI